ncbi:hypothetical protein PPERSA_11729 [Pseudocohnilembus persalinus]|uniref:Uncharacterized protein n=1 Tax=Pseudocohnilembus persalinus TaxID=266149 RepID=A0A0V0QGD8_PSEPJ|nr:hypothetical protein PPERSA_11729 [Pseudocohnilembus persalinus]|eukprot:KRX01282.1 hypothetical protein PPERSA_11729 [Pseudocohnilembus persalinus]
MRVQRIRRTKHLRKSSSLDTQNMNTQKTQVFQENKIVGNLCEAIYLIDCEYNNNSQDNISAIDLEMEEQQYLDDLMFDIRNKQRQWKQEIQKRQQELQKQVEEEEDEKKLNGIKCQCVKNKFGLLKKKCQNCKNKRYEELQSKINQKSNISNTIFVQNQIQQ